MKYLKLALLLGYISQITNTYVYIPVPQIVSAGENSSNGSESEDSSPGAMITNYSEPVAAHYPEKATHAYKTNTDTAASCYNRHLYNIGTSIFANNIQFSNPNSVWSGPLELWVSVTIGGIEHVIVRNPGSGKHINYLDPQIQCDYLSNLNIQKFHAKHFNQNYLFFKLVSKTKQVYVHISSSFGLDEYVKLNNVSELPTTQVTWSGSFVSNPPSLNANTEFVLGFNIGSSTQRISPVVCNAIDKSKDTK